MVQQLPAGAVVGCSVGQQSWAGGAGGTHIAASGANSATSNKAATKPDLVNLSTILFYGY